MKTILKIIGSILVLALLAVLFSGLLSSNEYEGEVSATLISPPEEIWTVISTPEQRQSRLPITAITGKDQNGLGLAKWTEQTEKDTWSRYEILTYTPPASLTLALMESSQDFAGLWTYTLTSNDGIHTTLTIHEKSRLNNFTLRSISTIKGRNSDLRAELRSIKRALRKNINTEEIPTQNAE